VKLQLEHVFNRCRNLEELHWLEIADEVNPAVPDEDEDDTVAPICGTRLQRLLVLRLNHYLPADGAPLASLLLAAPMLDSIFIENVEFDEDAVKSLQEAVRMRTALQRVRVVFLDSGCVPEVGGLLDELLLRMRTFCPRFKSGLVSPDYDCSDDFWHLHFCRDQFFAENHN
jgi:hypothetical protein